MDFYKNKIESLSLRAALAEYYLENPTFSPYWKLTSVRAQKLVRAHDISHLIFGCDTGFSGELAVQLWTRFGVEIRLSLREKIRYFFAFEALKLVLNGEALKFFLTRRKEFFDLKREIARRSKSMKMKWHYFNEEIFFDQSIRAIRDEFNIQVL